MKTQIYLGFIAEIISVPFKVFEFFRSAASCMFLDRVEIESSPVGRAKSSANRRRSLKSASSVCAARGRNQFGGKPKGIRKLPLRRRISGSAVRL
jgi:hypothetical protein